MKVNVHNVKVVKMYLPFKALQPKSQQLKALNFKYMYKSKFCKTSLHSRTVNSKKKMIWKSLPFTWNFKQILYLRLKFCCRLIYINHLDLVEEFLTSVLFLNSLKDLSLSTTFHYTLRRFVVNTLTIRSSLNFDIWKILSWTNIW